MGENGSDAPDGKKLEQEAQKEINFPHAITPDLMLAYRRCHREAWLKYHDPNLENDSVIDEKIPADVELDLGDGQRARLHKNYEAVTPDQLLRTRVALCTLPSGASSLLMINSGRSQEECRLKLAFDSYVLGKLGISCRLGLIRNRRGRLCEQIEISDYELYEMVSLINGVHKLVKKEREPEAKDAAAVCDCCQLAERCLPDEINIINGYDDISDELRRRLFAPRSDHEPLYVTTQGAVVSTTGNEIILTSDDKKTKISKPVNELSCIMLMGNIQITTQCVRKLCASGVPVLYFSQHGSYFGITSGPRFGVRNGMSLKGQILCATDPGASLAIACRMIKSKIHNQRTLLHRNLRGVTDSEYLTQTMIRLATLKRQAEAAKDSQQLLGIEGEAAAVYFDGLGRFVASCKNDFAMFGRNRRPPRDPVNVMLSFGYALLASDITVAVLYEGLNQWIGFFHTQRSGKPSLVLDLMEEFRPIIVDSLVIGIVSRNILKPEDFEYETQDDGLQVCRFRADAKKLFMKMYESKVSQLVTHPIFGYRVSFRKIFGLQVRVLCRVLRGDMDFYQGMETR